MSPAGQKIVNLISQRYITPSKQPDHPKRSYAYVKGADADLWGKAGAGHNLSGSDMGWAAKGIRTMDGLICWSGFVCFKSIPVGCIEAWPDICSSAENKRKESNRQKIFIIGSSCIIVNG